MTEQKAIEQIKSIPLIRLKQKQCDALEMSIEALEKQIPIKLNGNFNTVHCKCGNPIYYQTDRILHHYNYCCECGRKIEWTN